MRRTKTMAFLVNPQGRPAKLSRAAAGPAPTPEHKRTPAQRAASRRARDSSAWDEANDAGKWKQPKEKRGAGVPGAAPVRRNNAPGSRRGGAAAPNEGKSMAKARSAAQRAATRRMIAANRARTRGSRTRGKRRRNPAPAAVVLASNPRRGARRRVRRNPAGFPNMQDFVLTGAIDAAEALAGEVAVNLAASKLGFAQGTTIHSLVSAAVAVVAGFGASKVSRNAGKMVLAGGLMAPMRAVIKQANIPYASAALAGELDYLDGFGDEAEMIEVGAYPALSGEVEGYANAGDEANAGMIAATY